MKVLIIEGEYSLADAIAEIQKNDKFNVSIETDTNKQKSNIFKRKFS